MLILNNQDPQATLRKETMSSLGDVADWNAHSIEPTIPLPCNDLAEQRVEQDGADKFAQKNTLRTAAMLNYVICHREEKFADSCLEQQRAKKHKVTEIERYTNQCLAYADRADQWLKEVNTLFEMDDKEQTINIITRAMHEPRTARPDAYLFETVPGVLSQFTKKQKQSLLFPRISTSIERPKRKNAGEEGVPDPRSSASQQLRPLSKKQSRATADTKGKQVRDVVASKTKDEDSDGSANKAFALDDPAVFTAQSRFRQPSTTLQDFHPNLGHLFDIEKDFAFPVLVVEYKKQSQSNAQAFNQCRSYIVAALKFLDLIGITECPVFGLATSGWEGWILMGWMTRSKVNISESRKLDESLSHNAFLFPDRVHYGP